MICSCTDCTLTYHYRIRLIIVLINRFLGFSVFCVGCTIRRGNLTKVNLNGKSVTGVSGSAQANAAGSYTLGLFGPQADEVAGKATIDQKEIGFAGQKDANATLKKIATDAGLSATRAQAYA
ncbi:factor H binding protein domain-containing protein, partial [Streptococcus sp. S784/96/1]|uniref:factor H binding protein domain-containing protein n=1 Tax=Streptococcus sp. S784/96/1 TaxID=2653499 RepID=UPI00192E4CF2